MSGRRLFIEVSFQPFFSGFVGFSELFEGCIRKRRLS
jgi:hypothetical protein